MQCMVVDLLYVSPAAGLIIVYCSSQSKAPFFEWSYMGSF
jgi:hypothetical protein